MNYTNTIIASQHVAEIAVKHRGFILGSVDFNGNVSFSANPSVHTTIDSARVEAKRLARLNANKTFIIVQLVGAERVITQPQSVSI